jgi:hypothetical protein
MDGKAVASACIAHRVAIALGLRLAAAPTDAGLAVRDIWLLRLRALLARAHDDEPRYRKYQERYRDMAKTLGFEGHIAMAEAMP